MKKLYNEIVMDKDIWGDEFEEMLGRQIWMLLRGGQVCKVRDDDYGIVIIEHENDENKVYYGSPSLEWMTEEEFEDLQYKRSVEGK